MYSANIASTAFAGLIAAAIFPLHGKLGMSGWQWLFVIQGWYKTEASVQTDPLTLAGALTGFFAILCYPLLPDRPLDTRWLNEEERQLAHSRLFRDEVDRKEPGSVWSGVKQAVADPRVWLFCAIQNLHRESCSATSQLVSFLQVFTSSIHRYPTYAVNLTRSER
jgi:hypothetical protein